MSFTAFMTTALALAKAVPIINEWFHKFTEEWSSYHMHEDEQVRVSFRAEKLALNRAIARAENNEDIKNLSITLRRLNNNKLPKNASTIL